MLDLICISIIFICLYLILDSVEILINIKYYGFDSPISVNKFFLRKIYYKKKTLKFIYNQKVLKTIVRLRFLISLFILGLVILQIDSFLNSLAIFILIIFELYLRLRCQNRLSSSEHIIIFNLFCLLCTFLTKDYRILNFISLYIFICYTTNGIQKISSVKWRTGEGLKKLLKTNIYGNKLLVSIFHENKYIYFLLSWLIILFQLTFVFFIVNPHFCVIYLCLGILFHLFLAIFMKLKDFFLAFLSSYPFLFFTFLEIHNIPINIIYFYVF